MADVPINQIELEFGDGTYLFAFSLADLNELQIKCEATLGVIYGRLLKGRYQLDGDIPFGNPEEGAYDIRDLYHVVRIGLARGGRGQVDGVAVTVDPIKAREMADRYVIGRPLREGWAVATAVMSAAVQGYDPKDKAAPTQKKSLKPTKTDSSTIPQS